MPIRPLSLTLVALLFAGCGDTPKPAAAPVATDILMSIDGIEITFGDVEPAVNFLTSGHPEVGRKTVVQTVLEKYLVPLRLAERAFGEQRAQKLQQAKDLKSVVGNAYELEKQTSNLEVYQRKQLTRLQLEIPLAMFLFDPLLAGAVSDPIAVPRGYVVTSVHEYVETPLVGEDMVDATQVGYYTHTIGQWRAWITEQQGRLADKVSYVHPDYREALPTWCKPPK